MKSAAFTEEWLAARLASLLPEFPDVSLCVALSGGVDSVTLLGALAGVVRKPSIAGQLGALSRRAAENAAEAPLQTLSSRAASERSSAARRLRASSLRAIHIHHGLHANADAWSAHCAKLAKKLHVPLQVIKVHVPRGNGDSLEASARNARYAALASALEPGEILLTAHHQDDQLETVLLQLLRGAGVPGLAAMPEVAPFATGRLARPLLTRSRVDLEEWARAHHLTWLDDDTNTDERFDRNYLRRTILPLIRERWPGAGAAVSRTARHAAEARRLLDTLALTDVERAAVGSSLSARHLRTLDLDRRRNALRFWIGRAGFQMPDTRRLDEIAGPLLAARADANPQVRWVGTIVERHADLISIRPASATPGAASEAPPAEEQQWRWRESPSFPLTAPFSGTLSIVPDRHGPLDTDTLPEILSVQSRRGGETLRPAPGARTRRLKSLLQEARVPPAERELLPLICAGDKLIAVADRWLDASVHATGRSTHRARLQFSPTA